MNKRKSKPRQKKAKKNYYRTFQFILACIVILFTLVNKFQTKRTEIIVDSRDTEEFSDSAVYRNAVWADYTNALFEMDYTVGLNEMKTSKANKDEIRIPVSSWTTNETYWAAVYQQLLVNDKDFIIRIADSLSVIKKEQNLNIRQFANTIMTFVQDIEYSFVFEGRQCHTEPRSLCVDGQKFGIHSPSEFLYTLQGDCDTRAVLLMGVYKHLGYDPAIAISESYLHAMLLLNLPSSGAYLNRFGKKYYFWESTAKHWKLGVMPPATSNLRHWKIVL